MNIGIDANCLIFEHAGVGKYSQNLIKNLLMTDRKNQYFLYFAFLRHRAEREKIIKDFLRGRSKNVTYRIIPMPARWYEFLIGTNISINVIIKDKIDVYFAPYVAGIPRQRLSFGGQAKMVAMIHDLVFLRFPEHRGRRLTNYYFKRHKIAAENCQKIIAPSQATKDDIIKFLNVKSGAIEVIYEAADIDFRKIKNNSLTNRIIGHYFEPKIKYILSVGTLEPRKNLERLVTAYSLLPHNLQRDYKLVLVGAKGWNNSVLFRTIKNLNLADKIILTGFVLDADLPYIYNRASVFVYPSLYEGFGLPPLEAMACGVPVITANNSSLPEVIGSAGVLIDTQKEEEIAAAIRNVITNEKLRQKIIDKGLIQAKKFSWGKAAKQTLKVFEEIRN